MIFYLPVLIVVLSNTFYHVAAKSAPDAVNPFASLSVTYAIGAVTSILLYFITQKSGHLFAEYRQLNWSSFVLGFSVVGLEAGFLYMYKLGWNIGTGQIVTSSFLAVILLFIGYFVYHEAITPTKAAGILICMVGLYFINK